MGNHEWLKIIKESNKLAKLMILDAELYIE